MKASRRWLIPLSVLLLLSVLSFPALGTEYPGSFVNWTQQGTVTSSIVVSDVEQVSNVSVFIRDATTQVGFDWNAMLLTSPAGTTIYLFDLSAYQIFGTSLYLTRFIDTAPVIITDGVAPYSGSFRPGGSFSNFNGEWINGTWTLAVYNARPGSANQGAVTDWSLIINQATPIPTLTPAAPTPTPVPVEYREYHGDWFSWTGVSTTSSIISINSGGQVADVNVKMNVSCTASLDPVGMYLISPLGSIVGLFNKHDLEETTMYLTTFDDAASRSIRNGIAPYIGLYRPVESLAFFNNQTVTGDWTLVAFNDDAGNNGTITDWSLLIGIRDYFATPTPTPTSSPTPSVTPTPQGYRTPLTTPTPIPGECFTVITTANKVPYAGIDVTRIEYYVDVNFPVNNVDVEVTGWSQGPLISCESLDTKALFVTAPNGVIVKLFGKHDLEEKGLYLTYFDDDAEISILNDIAPYYGPHSPVVPLDKFRQEGTWSRGTWTLSWYNDCAGDFGTIDDFTLCLNQASPTPTPTPPISAITPTPGIPTPTPFTCVTYSGSFFSWTGTKVVTDTITVDDPGVVQAVRVHIEELYCANDLDGIGMYLLAPDGDDVDLFNKHNLSEHQLYLTTFRGDADVLISNGIAPYLGSYLPVGNLSDFVGKSITGDWTLVLYSDPSVNDGWLSDWDLEICFIPPPSPTPSPSPMTSPSPATAALLVLESGDYDGDGASDIGVFRAATGLWSVRGVGTSFFGRAGDVPVSGDYDGDGTTDISVFRPASGLWAIYDTTRTYYGKNGDTPVPGDYSGAGIADIGIFRGSSGLWAIQGRPRIYFGAAGDIPVPGDYTGNGSAEPSVFRGSSGLWAIRGETRFYLGGTGDIPLARDFFGDGTAAAGIFRPSIGLWAIRGLTRFYFGGFGDYPVAADFLGDGTEYPGIFRSSSGLWAIRGITRVYYGQSGDIPVAR